MRMLVRSGRTTGTAYAADANPVAFITNLKVSHVKHSQCNVFQISQTRIIKNYGGIGGRRLVAMLSKTSGYVQSRVARAVGTSIEVHGKGEMSASLDPIVTNNISAIEGIGGSKSGRLKSVGAGDGVGPAENVRQGSV